MTAVAAGADRFAPRRSPNALWEVLRLAGAEWGLGALTVLAGVVHQGATVVAFSSAAWLAGSVVLGHPVRDLTGGFVALALGVVCAPVANWLTQTIGHKFAFRLLARFRLAVYDGLERAAPGVVEGRRTGDLAAVAMGDVEILELFYAHTVTSYAIAGIVVLVSAAVLAAVAGIGPALLLVAAAAALATVPFWLGKRAGTQGRELRSRLGLLNAEVVDGVQGLRELVVFGRGDDYIDRIVQRTRGLQRRQLAYGMRSGIERGVTDGLLSVGLLAMLVTVAGSVVDGTLSFRALPVAVTMVIAGLRPVAEAGEVARQIGQIRAAAERVLAIMHREPNVVDHVERGPSSSVEPRVVFRDVRFRYSPEGEEVLQGLSFEIAPGETVALVGASGAGKTTCANLVLRFWDPVSGAVCLGEHDLRDFPQEELRRLVAVVPQDVYLFHGTIKENILLARPEASDDEVQAAAQAANAHEFIVRLPDGYDTAVGERGAQLSGGQRQRIAIARAFLKAAPVLVMDEAVSNLDTESEEALRVAMGEVRKGRTTMMIAHRLSTIRSADRIVVLEGGRAVETGTHDELVARGGTYAALVASQRDGLIAVTTGDDEE